MELKSESHWPPSNYPILFAIILLIATAITLALGYSESFANDLATYAYLLLVIGVIIRFFELAMPEHMARKIGEKEGVYSKIARDICIYLFAFFLISLAYGLLADLSLIARFIVLLGVVILFVLAIFQLLSRVVRLSGK